MRAIRHAETLLRRLTSLAIGTFRLSALHRGICRAGPDPGAARARWLRATAAGNRSRLRLQARLRKTPLDEPGWSESIIS